MAPGEQLPKDDAGLIAAAHAVASWARARRAEWDGQTGQSTVDSRQSPVDSRQSTVPSRQPPVASRQPPVEDRQSPVESRQSPAAGQSAAAPRQQPESTPRQPEAARPPVTSPPIAPPAPKPGDWRPKPAVDASASLGAEPLAAPLARDAERAVPREPARPAEGRPLFGEIEEPSQRGKWIGIAAVALIAVGGAAYGARYLLIRPAKPAPAATPARAPEPAAKPAALPPHAGALHVTSTPTGAQVLVDGKARGATPLVIEGIAAGRHNVEIQSAEGTIRRSVTITTGRTTDVDEAIYSGWVTVFAPFDVTISEGGRPLRTDDQNQIMLRPGPHALRVSNATLAFDQVSSVDVKPGQVTPVHITPAKSSITITSSDAAEVWVDGSRVGAAPVFALPMDLGTHEVVIRRSAGGERQMSVTVTTKPLTVNVDFSKSGA